MNTRQRRRVGIRSQLNGRTSGKKIAKVAVGKSRRRSPSRLRGNGTRPLRAEPDRLAASRQRAHGCREPRLRRRARRHAAPADRRHRPGADGRGRGGGDPRATSSGSAIGWDEGPVRQSERAERHREAAAQVAGAAGRRRRASLRATTLLRADGSPTYQLASVVDDLDFGITHVIRGSDHRATRRCRRS